ncbi:hypothetical protein [Mesorhizobium sp.]|uniref:hypothetical protein n=1 Tax=Mesorhizobium sp. TaxID=1871066 RepID=UPI00120F8AED|nr:hypothetical protein [Mesorhizobium sp.]TIN79775.1 MAG: hypothetical protein E5Y09_04900 [Mesorhizobium sp.]
MSRRIAFPFLTLSDSAVTATSWEVSLDGSDWTDMGEHLPNWDPSSTLRLRRTIRVVPEVAARDLSLLQDHLQLAVGVRFGTGQGRLPRMILDRYRTVLEQGRWEWQTEFELPGRNLSVVLDLLSEVTLAVPPISSMPLSPKSAGDRLWSDSTRVRLEGEEPRFPIETADFGALLGDTMGSSAPWHLHWSPWDWRRDFHGAVRLYLNERALEFLERIENQDGPTLQVLLADIMSQICERFILDPEASEMMERAEPGSLGAQAGTWLRKAWPDRDAAFIRSVLESRPGLFRSAILALSELGEA